MISKLLSSALAFVTLALMTSCQTGPVKPDPVPPGGSSDVSGLPWNRPRSWEASAGYGSMLPQSH